MELRTLKLRKDASSSVDITDSNSAEKPESESFESYSDSDVDHIAIEDSSKKHKLRWNMEPPKRTTEFRGESFSLPPYDFD
ncbi:Hypothetical predicted protein [Octopus vulgaris]|uniref:Uncharacterized protein n=1 Tax=Octopus vulgaris TaxID=6645 RepID=A0AA36BVG0_OCTVU|nr:Hypothetical predicted protein [Octopus vulgaris]